MEYEKSCKQLKVGDLVVCIATRENNRSLIEKSPWSDLTNPTLNSEMVTMTMKIGRVICVRQNGYLSVTWCDECNSGWTWHPAWLRRVKQLQSKYKFLTGKEE